MNAPDNRPERFRVVVARPDLSPGAGNAGIGTSQTGSDNYSAYTVMGNNNSLMSTQTGQNLSYSASVIGSGKNITITQQGQGSDAATTGLGLPAGAAGAIAAGARR